ncbi:MAG: SDR family NAD(P)-dependent oxidoreductase, partial [Myxococcota bacterium]
RARERPGATIRPVSTDDRPVADALAALWVERGIGGVGVTEVGWRGSERRVRRLAHAPAPPGALPVGPGAVVLATGGARGITLAPIARRVALGCTVVAVGRSAPEARPAAFPATPDGARAYYLAASTDDPTATAGALRRRFDQASARWEVADALAARPGLRYVVADVTDPDAVDRVVRDVVAAHGRLDLVVHGAGVQHSARIERRTLAQIRATLDVKLGGVHHLLAACARWLPGPVPIHASTSAYSVFGNDGQADYGAANEALDRLCALGRRTYGPPWSTVAWLAWDGVGMTRSSEYRALAEARGLSGLGVADGQRLFDAALRGAVAIHVPLTPLEARGYDVAPVEDGAEWVGVHEVRGRPTLPGAFALDRLVAAVAAGRDLGPTVVVEAIAFDRMVRWGAGAAPSVRPDLDPDGAWVRARLVGELTHRSGAVLSRDVSFCRARIAVGPPVDAAGPRRLPGRGRPVADPYCAPGADVALGGAFDCLRGIAVADDHRHATFVGAFPSEAMPALLLDAAWRLGAMYADGTDRRYVPVRVGRVTIDRRVDGPVTLVAAAPVRDGDAVTCPWVEGIDAAGRVVLRAEDSVAQVLA